MTCSCPKCNAAIELDHVGVPEEGSVASCPACNARLQIVKESFARAAYGRLAEKSCVACGKPLGTGINCNSCGSLYPDFFIAADPAALKRKAREQKRQQLFAAFKGIEFTLPKFSRGPSLQSRPVYTATGVSRRPSAGFTGMKSGRLPQLIVCLVAIVALAGGGYALYTKKQAEKRYVDTYFKALYGIKTESDLSVKVQSRILSDWKTAQGSGRAFSPFAATEEIGRLSKVRTEVDKLLNNQLAKPPEKFAAAGESIRKLNDQCVKLNALAVSPPPTLALYTDTSEKVTAEFAKSAKSLKSSLPEEMSAEFEKAKVKYKNLREF